MNGAKIIQTIKHHPSKKNKTKQNKFSRNKKTKHCQP